MKDFIGGIIGTEIGLFFLTFILVFAIIFSILERTQIIRMRNVNFLLAIVIGLMAASSSIMLSCFSVMVSRMVVSLVVILMAYLLIGFVLNKKSKLARHILGIIGVVSVLSVIGYSLTDCGITIPEISGAWIWGVIGILVITGLVIWIMKGPNKEPEDSKNTVSSNETDGKTSEDDGSEIDEDPFEPDEDQPYDEEYPYGEDDQDDTHPYT